MRRALVLVLFFAGCGAKNETEDYLRKSKQITGRVILKSISRTAKQIVEEKGALPEGSIGPTPAQPCCSTPEKTCPVDAAQWRDPLWDELFVSIDRPGYFQYSYQSDGTSFTASATGDVLCESKPVTFTISGAIGADGTLTVDESEIESSTAK
ncbi:MAG: hypothetical protein ACKV2T_27920 [Kofleriaceae bacterium]